MQTQSLITEQLQFKVVLKRCLNLHSYYSADEFIMVETDCACCIECTVTLGWSASVFLYCEVHPVGALTQIWIRGLCNIQGVPGGMCQTSGGCSLC